MHREAVAAWDHEQPLQPAGVEDHGFDRLAGRTRLDEVRLVDLSRARKVIPENVPDASSACVVELEGDVEEAAASLGAKRFTIFRRIILPSLVPAMAAGAALAFARAISEYGSLVLLSGNLPFKTEVVSVRVLSFIENGNSAAAAALASVMLAIALVVIVGLDVVQRRVARRG